MYYQVNITAPGGARVAELHQALPQDPLNTNGDAVAVLWGPHDPHTDKASCCSSTHFYLLSSLVANFSAMFVVLCVNGKLQSYKMIIA